MLSLDMLWIHHAPSVSPVSALTLLAIPIARAFLRDVMNVTQRFLDHLYDDATASILRDPVSDTHSSKLRPPGETYP